MENKANSIEIPPRIEESRLFKELYLLVFALNQSASLQEIFNKSLAGIVDVLKVDRASLLTFDDENVMHFRAWINLSDGFRLAVEGHSPWAAEEPDPQPVLVSDVIMDSDLADLQMLFEEEGIRALGFIPLLEQNQLIGKFMLYYNQPHTFDQEEIHLAQIVASHVARAIERSWSRQALMNYANQQYILAEVGQQALRHYYRLPELRDQIVRKAAEVLKADMGELLEIEPDGQTLRLVAGTGWQEGVVGRATVEAGNHSQAGYTVERRRPVVVQAYKDETRFEMPPLLRSHHAVSGITVVVEGGEERPYGVLGVHTTSLRRFTKDEVSFLNVLANILAAAVQQNQALTALQSANEFLEERVAQRTSSLHKEIAQREMVEAALQRESNYISQLQQITETANGAFSIKEAFQNILEIICNFTGWSLAHVYIQASELLDEGYEDELISSGIWRWQDNEHFELFQRLTNETRVKRGFGWLGKVFQSGEPAWIMSDRDEPDNGRTKQLLAMGIKAEIAFPVIVGDEVTAVVEFFTPEFQEPEAELLGVMAQIGTQMGRIVERERANRLAKQNEKKLRELAGNLIRVQEEERRRISHELHDEIGQSLSALKLELDLLGMDMTDEPQKGQLDRASKIAKITLERIQRLAYDIRPPELDTIGLNAALHDLCLDFAQRSNIEVKYIGTESIPANISEPIKLSIYGALQEGLNNVAKHAGATRIQVRLKCEKCELSLSVTDNGRGLPQKQGTTVTNPGLGLLGLTERFARLGGSVTIASQENAGTTLLVVAALEE